MTSQHITAHHSTAHTPHRTSSPSFFSHSECVRLPPLSEGVEVLLTGYPNESGPLEVLGVDVRFLNVQSVHSVAGSGRGITVPEPPTDENGKGEDMTKVNVDVVGAQPLLHLHEDNLHGSALCVLEGELTALVVNFVNVGPVPIGSIELSSKNSGPTRSGRVMAANCLVDWDDAVLAEALPLQPTESVELTLNVYGLADE